MTLRFFAGFALFAFFAVQFVSFRLKAEATASAEARAEAAASAEAGAEATPQLLSGQPIQDPTFPAPAVGASMESLRSTFVTYWDWKLATQPELATRVGRTEFNDRWRDLSKRGRDRVREGEDGDGVLQAGLGFVVAPPLNQEEPVFDQRLRNLRMALS